MARNELKVRCFISIDGADPVPFGSLTVEQREEVSQRMADNVGRTLSAYYSQHMDEYVRI